jgi:hypothetical protein
VANKAVELSLGDYEQEGLYLVFGNSGPLVLTKDNIAQAAKYFWENPRKISSKIKQAAEFQRCSFCPLKKTGGLCDAIRPTFPFLGALDKYLSYDEVVAVYNGKEGGISVRRTTMQNALRYLSVLSLLYYCQVTRKYWKHFLGIMPLMEAQEIAARLFLNFFYLDKGCMRTVEKALSKFRQEITITSQNQVRRMNLVCNNDAFMNAFVNTQIITQILALDICSAVQNKFDSRRPP